jgi:hypothetical protein
MSELQPMLIFESLYAEIERLKEENAHFAWRDKDKNKLITELADALEEYDMLPCPKYETLIQRAREAVLNDRQH